MGTVAAWFRDPDVGGVILTGAAGVGKSSLAASAARALPAAGIARITGNPALSGVPFGALAHVIPAGDVDELGDVHRPTVIRSLSSEAGRIALVVDDPGDLDEGSLGIVAQLVSTGSAFVLATVRSDTSVPTPLVALERSSNVRRLVVGPLDRSAVEAALAGVLGGPVAPSTVDALLGASAGNPLYVRELVEQALSDRALVDDHGEWRLVAGLGPSRRLIDVIADRIGRLPDDQLDLAKVLALASPVRWSSLDRGGYGAATCELEQTGVVVVREADDPIVDLAHPLHGDILRSGLGVLERRRLLGELIDWLDTDDATIDERLRVAEWQLSLGRQPDIRTLEEGAHRAWSARDHAAAERFARAALDGRTSPAMAAVLVEALIHTGRCDEADLVAQHHLDIDDGGSPRDRSRLVGLRVFNDLWYRGLPDAAAAVLAAERRLGVDRVTDDELFIQEAYVERTRVDAEAVLALIDRRDWTEEVAPQGLLLTAQMMADVGRVRDGVATIERAARAARAGAAMAVSTPGSIDAARVRITTLAGRFDRADDLIAELQARPDCLADPFIRSYLLLSAGRIALWRGRPRTARRHFTEGRRIGEQSANRVTVMGCAAGAAVASAYLGDSTACAQLLPELESYDLAQVVRPSLATGIAWSLVATGHPERARALLLDEAEHSCRRRERSDAASLAFEAARIGAAGRGRQLLESLLPDVDGLAELLCGAGIALATGSVALLAEGEEALSESGIALVAAELATAAARAHRRDGAPRAATAARARALALLSTCEGAATPGVVFDDAVSPLSDREREIAGLAATGLSNQEIADRLFVSVRTVGNHLQHAYTKLGVTGRSQLTEALGTSV